MRATRDCELLIWVADDERAIRTLHIASPGHWHDVHARTKWDKGDKRCVTRVGELPKRDCELLIFVPKTTPSIPFNHDVWTSSPRRRELGTGTTFMQRRAVTKERQKAGAK